MHDLIDRLLDCRAGVLKFCALADDQLPKLKNKRYSEYKLEPDEWKLLGLIREVLQEPRNAQSTFSSETEPTLWRAIPILECIQTNWTTFSKLDKFKPLHTAIQKGLKKLEKWYTNIKQSDSYYTCLVLHPAIKQVYCEQKWDSVSFKMAKNNFEKLFDSYYIPKKSNSSTESTVASFLSGYGSNFILSTLSASSSLESVVEDSRKELCDYLESPRDINAKDPIKWWGYHSQQYPTLSRIACDYLAVQGSSVALERAFSSAGITDDLRRNRLETEAFGKLQILKYAYHTNFLNGADEAATHEPFHEIEIIE